jgi:tRNA threonylcarbamoyladenosine modification (KEOPS) complex  Pcc1 subunit
MALMHEHQKTVYKRNGIEIRLEPGEETVKVKIRATDAEEGTADA